MKPQVDKIPSKQHLTNAVTWKRVVKIEPRETEGLRARPAIVGDFEHEV